MKAKSLLRFLKRVAGSRLGQALFVIHLCLLVYDFAPKPVASADMPCVVEPSTQGLLAARPFHYHYESGLLKTLLLLDVPGLVLAGFISILLSPLTNLLQLCEYTQSWVAAGVLLLGTSLQWWLLGHLVEELTMGRRARRPLA